MHKVRNTYHTPITGGRHEQKETQHFSVESSTQNTQKNIKTKRDFSQCSNDDFKIDSAIPMHNKDRYIAIDCEMVGVGPNGSKSALARVSIVNWEGKTVLDTHVRVLENVTDFRTFVSGIRAQDIESDNAMDPEKCRALVKSILRGKILIGHGLENDLAVLKIRHPWCDVRDSATYPPLMRQSVDSTRKPQFHAKKLRDLAWEEMGKVIQVYGAAHSSLEDALAALELYKKHMSEWDKLIMWQIQMNWSKQMEINRLQMVAQSQTNATQPQFMKNGKGRINSPKRNVHKNKRSNQYTKSKFSHAHANFNISTQNRVLLEV